MIGLGAGGSGHRLRDVEPVHGVGRLVDAAAGGELAGVAQIARTGRQEIGVEGDDHVGVGEIVVRVGGLTEGLLGAGARGVWSGGIPLVPLGGRIELLNAAKLSGHGGRGHRLGENPDARAILCLLLCQRLAQFAGELAPRADLTVKSERLGTIGVVELEHRALRVRVAGAERGGMLGVALHLGGPAHVAFGEQAVGKTVHRHGGGEEQRTPRNQVFRLAHVRHDVFGGLPGAGRHTGQRQRRAHHLHEVAAAFVGVFIIRPADGLAWKFALQQVLKFRCGGQVVQAAPVVAPASAFQPLLYSGQVQLVPWITHRWQVEQLVRVRAS